MTTWLIRLPVLISIGKSSVKENAITSRARSEYLPVRHYSICSTIKCVNHCYPHYSHGIKSNLSIVITGSHGLTVVAGII